ncbi:Gfo/Idh/MocA family oxidoreductase [Bacteroides graminisolvens]|uniref:Gfo/Idh/MocA family protein n=1 Tax=Bacteroides graminisolvens TaxID=477666 RepID=UPI0023F23DD9|nr:Gfo/Idh/MocA family oxidoreductase [Bacteroides graminisolvens]
MNKVRVGIIGMGRMGLTHFSIINTHPAVEMTAVADTSSTMLSMMKKMLPNVKQFTDFNDLLKSGLVDAVIVCTPSSLHYPVCKLACENGISVFCEKPFTTDPKLAEDLANMFEAKGLVNQVGYVYRFDPVFNKTKELLNQGAIGKVCHVNAQFLSATISKMQPEKGWRAKRENGGGATYEMGSHVIDLMEFLFGKPTKVVGSMLNQVYSEAVEDVVDVQIMYEGGVSGNLHVNWSEYTYRKPMLKLDIHGTKGKIVADLYGYKLNMRKENKELGLEQGWTTVPMNMIPDPTPFYVRGTCFTNQLYAFADAIIESRKTIGCSFRAATDTQEVIHTIFDNDLKK